MKPTAVKVPLVDPLVINPIIEQEPKEKIPTILIKTVQDTDKDKILGKG